MDQSVYAEIYKDQLLPTLRHLEETKAGLSKSARQKAVKFAADRSLALTGSGSCWSAALRKRLELPVEENHLADFNQLNEKRSIFRRSKKIERKKHSIMENSDEADVMIMPIPHVNFDVWHSKSIRRRARKQRLLALNSTLPQRCSRCTSTSRNLARCIYRKTSKRSKIMNFIPESISFEGRICKIDSNHKFIFKRAKKSLKRTRRKVHQVGSSVTDGRILLDRVQMLQQLVPGGSEMKVDHLLHEALDYVFFLKYQVDVMKSLVAVAGTSS